MNQDLSDRDLDDRDFADKDLAEVLLQQDGPSPVKRSPNTVLAPSPASPRPTASATRMVKSAPPGPARGTATPNR